MRPALVLLLLLAGSASAKPGRSARLLVDGEPTATSEQPAPAVVVTPPSAAATVPHTFKPVPRDRTLKLLAGLGTSLGAGVVVPVVVGGGGILIGTILTVLTEGKFNPYWGLVPAVGLAWVVAPVLVALVMDGFSAPGRTAIGALVGAAAGVLLAVACWATPVALLGVALGFGGPSLGAVVALHTAPDEAFLPPALAAPLSAAAPVVPVFSARF